MWNRHLMTVFKEFEEEFELLSYYKYSKPKGAIVNESLYFVSNYL